jgi:hypothetical protein
MAKVERAPKERFQPHWLIRRRADWLRDVMASDLSGPAKAVGYALAVTLSHKTMAAQVGVPALAKAAGMSERQVKDALAVLVAEGWLTRKDGGRHPNTYQAVEAADGCGAENRPTTAMLSGGLRSGCGAV